MALSRGMTALRAALGAVGGGLEGYAQFKELERKRQMEQEAARRSELGMLLSSKQVRLTPMQQMPEMAPAMTPPPAGGMSSIDRAVQTVESGQPPAAAPMRQPPAPRERITLAGQEFGIAPALTPQEETDLELKKYQAQQDVIEKRQQAARDRANRGFFSVLKRANYFGEGSKDLDYDEVKDIDLEPFFKEYTQTRQAESALERAGIIARASAGRGGYIQGVDPATGQPQYYFAPSGGGVPQPTGVQAPGKESPLSERAKKIQETTRPLSADDAAFVKSFMPTPKMDAKGNVVGYDPPQRRLPAGQALVSRGADIVGGLTGEAMYMGASPEAQRLSNIINQQADRRALAEQGGRLSDRDVAIKRAEVAIRSGDVKNDPVLYRKLNDVLSWAQTEPAPQAAQPSAPPTPRPTAQSQGISKAQFANQWKAANPKGANESLEAYARRIQSAWMASQGGR